jgi:hypothetical protein
MVICRRRGIVLILCPYCYCIYASHRPGRFQRAQHIELANSLNITLELINDELLARDRILYQVAN